LGLETSPPDEEILKVFLTIIERDKIMSANQKYGMLQASSYSNPSFLEKLHFVQRSK
jgi:hypothetical protein